MNNLINEFNVFLNFLFNTLTTSINWLTTNIIGEILIFFLIVSLFFFLIKEIKN